MPLWKWGRNASEEAALPQAPLPRPGEVVQLQFAREEGVSAAQSARVSAVGFRRLFLDSLGPAPLTPRASLTITFVSGDALYRFETRVVGPLRGKSFCVVRPRRVARIQRRQYYRLSFESPTTFRLLTPDGRRDGSGPVAARLVNLSGGGTLLAASRPLPAGLAVAVRVPAGTEGDLLDIDAEVLDCHVATQGKSRIYLVRLRFFDAPRTDPADREAIVAHIFHQQRIMLKGRKLLRA